MKRLITNKMFAIASVAGLLISVSNTASAQQPYPYYGYNQAPMPQAAAPAPQVAAPAQAPAQMPAQMPARPYGYNPYYRPAPMPYGNPYAYGPRGPYNNGPFSGGPFNRGPFNSGPFNSGPFNNGPWGNGRGARMPFESNFTPWSRRFWDELGDGGDNPFRNMDEWMKPGDPKEGAAQMWDDLLNAPSEMGKMPGGWTAPSISVPNPIDVGDEFRNAAEDMPDEMRNQMDNINIQTW